MGDDGKSPHLCVALHCALPPPSPRAGRVNMPPLSEGGLLNWLAPLPEPPAPGATLWLVPSVAQLAATAMAVTADASVRSHACRVIGSNEARMDMAAFRRRGEIYQWVVP